MKLTDEEILAAVYILNGMLDHIENCRILCNSFVEDSSTDQGMITWLKLQKQWANSWKIYYATLRYYQSIGY